MFYTAICEASKYKTDKVTKFPQAGFMLHKYRIFKGPKKYLWLSRAATEEEQHLSVFPLLFLDFDFLADVQCASVDNQGNPS